MCIQRSEESNSDNKNNDVSDSEEENSSILQEVPLFLNIQEEHKFLESMKQNHDELYPDLSNLPDGSFYNKDKNLVCIPLRRQFDRLVMLYTYIRPESIKLIENKTVSRKSSNRNSNGVANYYATCHWDDDQGCDKYALLSHIIAGKPKPGFVIDHLDRNKLNNAIDNLQEKIFVLNAFNVGKTSRKTSSKYKGVYFEKTSKTFNATVTDFKDDRKKQIYLGRFKKEIHAAYCYNQYVSKFDGAFLNVDEYGEPLSEPIDFIDYQPHRKQIHPRDLVDSSKEMGRGVQKHGSGYRVCIHQKQYGTHATLKEANDVAKNVYENLQQQRENDILNLPITYTTINEEGKDISVPYIMCNGFKILVDEDAWHSIQLYGSLTAGMTTLTTGKKMLYVSLYFRADSPTHINPSGRLNMPLWNWLLYDQIKNKKDGESVDHLNQNRADNRKSNLLLRSASEQNQNKKRDRKKEKYIGIQKQGNGWLSKIRFRGKEYYLGYFKTEEAAASAYDRKAIEFYGEYANVNFPSSKKRKIEI